MSGSTTGARCVPGSCSASPSRCRANGGRISTAGSPPATPVARPSPRCRPLPTRSAGAGPTSTGCPVTALSSPGEWRGPARCIPAATGFQMISNGTLTINHSDLPFTGNPERTDGFHFLALKIPLAGNEQLAARARNLTAAPLAQEHWMTRLMDAAPGRDRCAAARGDRCNRSPYRPTGIAGARPGCRRLAGEPRRPSTRPSAAGAVTGGAPCSPAGLFPALVAGC